MSDHSRARGPVDPRLLKHARSSRRGVALLALLGAGQTAATVMLVVALTRLVLIFADRGRLARTLRGPLAGFTLGPATRTSVIPVISLLAGVFILRAVLSWAEQVVAQRTAARVADELRSAVLAAALRRGPAWVATFGEGRLSALLLGGLDSLRPWFSGYLPALVLAFLLPPVVLIVMASADPASALITLIALPLVPIFGALIGIATAERAQERWDANSRLAGHFLDVVRGLPTLRIFGRAERQIAVVEQMTECHRSTTMQVLRVAFLSSTALDLVATLSVGLVAVEAGLRVAAGDLSLGPALLVILLAPEAYRPMREVAVRFHASADAGAVIGEIDEVLSELPEPIVSSRPVGPVGPVDPVDPVDPGGTRNSARCLVRDAGTLPRAVVTEVRVRHPDAPCDALVLPSLEIASGEFVALRGASGAGKTTALRVLAGVQAIVEGLVELSGPRALYLPQSPTLPHVRSIADALLLDGEFIPAGSLLGGDSDVDRLELDEEPTRSGSEHGCQEATPALDGRPAAAVLFEALEAVGLATEVASLPAGLDTPLGERGHGMSSGQRQRLALARLLREARRRPTLLLLDEPTAHLDAVTEQLVIEQLRTAATRGCAVVVVAHRPALLAAVDRGVELVAPIFPRPDLDEESRLVQPTPTHPVTESSLESRIGIGAEAGGTSEPVSTNRADRQDRPRAWEVRTGRRLAQQSGTAVALGSAAWLAGVTLTGAAAWLLVRASTLPPVLTLSVAVVTVRASAVARPLLRYLERLVSHQVAFARLGTWRAQVYADLIPRVPGPALRRRGELLTRVVEDVDLRVDGLLRGRLPAAAAGTALTIAAAISLVLLPAAGAALATGLLVAAVLAPAMGARRGMAVDEAGAQARAELADAVIETVQGVEELASRPAATALAVPVERSRKLAGIEAEAARTAGTATGLAHLGLGLAVTGGGLLAASAVSRGVLHAEFAAVLVLGMVALAEPVLGLPDAAIARRRAAGASERLRAISGHAPLASSSRTTDSEIARSTSGRDDQVLRPRCSADLRIRGLVAGWDRDRVPALRGADLDLSAGGRVALCGPSGSGKSTLAAVLAGLLDAESGSIEWGGANLWNAPGSAARARIALVGDGADHIFASTVRENLRLANPGATDAELRAVLQRVCLGEWLARLSSGLDTWLGEGATTISGGEHRRLVTARALLTDPDVLVLDEPTEGLDEPTAFALMTDLLEAASGRGVLLLTHRREGLEQMDVVYRLVDGRLRRQRSVQPV